MTTMRPEMTLLSLQVGNMGTLCPPSSLLSQLQQVTHPAVRITVTENIVVGESIVPGDIAATALYEHHINLSYCVPDLPFTGDKEEYQVDFSTITISPTYQLLDISNYKQWHWNGYAELLIKHHPQKLDIYTQCMAYHRLIHECQQQYDCVISSLYTTSSVVPRMPSHSPGILIHLNSLMLQQH